jgi:hypothetical protein
VTAADVTYTASIDSLPIANVGGALDAINTLIGATGPTGSSFMVGGVGKGTVAAAITALDQKPVTLPAITASAVTYTGTIEATLQTTVDGALNAIQTLIGATGPNGTSFNVGGIPKSSVLSAIDGLDDLFGALPYSVANTSKITVQEAIQGLNDLIGATAPTGGFIFAGTASDTVNQVIYSIDLIIGTGSGGTNSFNVANTTTNSVVGSIDAIDNLIGATGPNPFIIGGTTVATVDGALTAINNLIGSTGPNPFVVDGISKPTVGAAITALGVLIAGGGSGSAGATGPTGATGPGVPVGGLAGDFLIRGTGPDYTTHWATPSFTATNVTVTGQDINGVSVANVDEAISELNTGRFRGDYIRTWQYAGEGNNPSKVGDLKVATDGSAIYVWNIDSNKEDALRWLNSLNGLVANTPHPVLLSIVKDDSVSEIATAFIVTGVDIDTVNNITTITGSGINIASTFDTLDLMNVIFSIEPSAQGASGPSGPTPYIPGNPASWDDPGPTSIEDAIDRLAAWAAAIHAAGSVTSAPLP